jgi:hypothetical protein
MWLWPVEAQLSTPTDLTTVETVRRFGPIGYLEMLGNTGRK